MAKKDNTVLYVLIGAAVVGYFAFKKGGILNSVPAVQSPSGVTIPQGPIAGTGNALPGIATELPSQQDVGVYFPQAPITGMSIDFL